LPGTGFFDPATLDFGAKSLNTQYELTTRLTPDKTVLVTDVRLDPANAPRARGSGDSAVPDQPRPTPGRHDPSAPQVVG
jgi:hypothetical protein